MSTESHLLPALLAVFAVVTGAILLLMASTWLLSRRHRRRRFRGTAATRTLTLGDLVSVDRLAEGFRADADSRRRAAWRDQAQREHERNALRESELRKPASTAKGRGGPDGGRRGARRRGWFRF